MFVNYVQTFAHRIAVSTSIYESSLISLVGLHRPHVAIGWYGYYNGFAVI